MRARLAPEPVFPVFSIYPGGKFVYHGLANSWMEPMWDAGKKVQGLRDFKAVRSASGNAWLTDCPFYSWLSP